MKIQKQKLRIHTIPALLCGAPSEKLYLYIHGQGGNKEEAFLIAKAVCPCGYQVLSIDLPEHGERTRETGTFLPWLIVPELTCVMTFARKLWKHISLFAVSIGAWFSMLSFNREPLQRCLLVSPVLDMRQLLLKMMEQAHISLAQLEQEQVMTISSGQTLSWINWQHAQTHPVKHWNSPTKILYGESDTLIEFSSVTHFAEKFHCDLTVLAKGEHWFHSQEQLKFLSCWLKQKFQE